ncbi:MAG: hypothetical protein UV64_C0040G0005 [Parcubacteria group bacterium GW2011_GWC1_43_11b]|uniref:Uncharacterized protein n=2 Tax=Candidatus Vogeliibacteriota TaxID=1817922 RepID=A0A1G2QCU4_9BACT|nr:MAG: hypothetical protein UV64_C0040G0005 [Parcubacteria group bacterium GW2011_GWC1_43_11b]OHA57929.1 MAG: hypothetical protein A2370_02030 [Candidatus Vogelbacteria bacterium RIFOXYB1_FULL_42_16]OHA59710.1 MAG: hypothetical protein A2607_01215 [Candidatus Vogelbacteria bacterium RIFOXYD1_FULL_42_15]
MDISNNNESQGPMIGVILVMAILIVGGVYMLFTRLNQNPLGNPIDAPSATSGDIELTSTSTEISSIEADAAKIQLDAIGADADNLDKITQ